MRILVVGSGGREHALAWKLKQSPQVDLVYVAPGNAGTAEVGQNVDIGIGDIPALVAFAREKGIDLTVVGPEAPLVDGLVDGLQAAGLLAFGPTAAAARLEGSKAFAKLLMLEEGIPTPPAQIFSDYEAARDAVARWSGPLVVKADGLAAGKGVILCDGPEEAQAALHQIMVERVFGAAGDQVLLEEWVEGEEVSLLAFCDGSTVVPLLPARDYKRALDGDQGLNTGGMGGYAPSGIMTPTMIESVVARVLQPTISGMRRRGTPYTGILYAGLMLTADGPQVLEFNARFGDPETQLLLPLLQTDLVDVMLACIQGDLESVPLRWHDGYSVGVVLASGGYPGAYETGKVISGLDEAGGAGSIVFHAGTQRQGDDVLTAGGRVLAVTGTGTTLEDARQRAYTAASRVHFQGAHFRTDIARAYGATPGVAGASAQAGAYAQAGVDIDAGERAVALMKDAVRSTYTPEVLTGIGAFGGSISVETLAQAHKLVLVATNDGVGTKTIIAEALGIYDTVGHDIVNHCANDILVQGARPLFFLDYIAAAKLDPEQIATVVGGCAAACKALGCVLIGGETAEMPGVYRPGAFDLVGTMVGWVDRDKLLDGSRLRPGDILLGLPSSGLHTNGFSLARRVLEPLGWDTIQPGLAKPLGEALLVPHRAYLREVETLWAAGVSIKAMSHLTGGAYIENIPRALPGGIGVTIDRTAWEVPGIFRLIQKQGDVADLEMYRVYNMGIGLILMVAPEEVDRARAALPELIVMGEAIAYEGTGPRVRL
jgi:phosphoribosylamine--glycine ligase / phosphoribosylformylglycinamidine cyclo-ligase